MEQHEIIAKYLDYAAQHHKLPSFFTFPGKIGLSYNEFREKFKNKDQLFEHIWGEIFDRTMAALMRDGTFQQYRAYEKMLAFHYTFLSISGEYRAALKLEILSHKIFIWDVPSLATIKTPMLAFVAQIVQEAQQNGEIPQRALIQQQLNKLTWYQFVYILRFWASDKTENQDNTDAAVEKSTAFVFEILQRNLVDVGFDFGKFVLQNIKH